MDADIRREATGFAKNWWLFLITGLAWLMIAIIVLRFDTASIATVGVLIGIMFLGAALNEFLASSTVVRRVEVRPSRARGPVRAWGRCGGSSAP